MALQLDDLGLLDEPAPASGAATASGTPLSLPLASIDEDPQQPRQEFDEQALQELAATIAQRGVRQPVSVRPHPREPGRWMLNFGARRLRASRLAGCSSIPAFVDHTADSYDQVLENEQRQGLAPLELALFIQRRLQLGETQADIAQRLGKSKAYVTYATALIDPPAPLLQAYRAGQCRGLAELYELRKLHEAKPDAVAQWLNDHGDVSRAEVAELKAQLRPAAAAAHRPQRPVLLVQYQGQCCQLVAGAVPAKAGHVVITQPQGQRQAVPASELQLLGYATGEQRSTV